MCNYASHDQLWTLSPCRLDAIDFETPELAFSKTDLCFLEKVLIDGSAFRSYLGWE